MPADGYEVAEGELRTFASALNGTADKMSASAGAVRGVSYNVTTWGVFGQFFSIAARNATNGAAGQLDKGAGSVRDAATGVDDTAQSYVDVDSHFAENVFGGGK